MFVFTLKISRIRLNFNLTLLFCDKIRLIFHHSILKIICCSSYAASDIM